MCAFSNLTNSRQLVLGPEKTTKRVVLPHPLSEPQRLPYIFSDRKIGARALPDDGPIPRVVKKSRICDKDDGLKCVSESLPIFDNSPARLGKLMQTLPRAPKWETSEAPQRKRKFVKDEYNTKMVKMFGNLRDLRFELQTLKTSLETIQIEEGEVSMLESDKAGVEESGKAGGTLDFMKREFVGFRQMQPTSDNQPVSEKKPTRRASLLPTAPRRQLSRLPVSVSLPDI